MMTRSASTRIALGWVAVLAVLGITSWFGWQALNEAKPAAGGRPGGGQPPAAVKVAAAEVRAMVETLSVTGTIRAVSRAQVAARESAAVIEVLVDEGDEVAEGALLARLDPRRLQAQTQEARAALTSARADLSQRQAEADRAEQDEQMMRELWDQRAVAEREYLDSVRERKVATARVAAAAEMIQVAEQRLDLLEVRLADLEVRAPFAGQVVARHVEPGEWLAPGAAVVTLVLAGQAEAWLELPERHVGRLRKTAPERVELRVAGVPEPFTAARLTLIPEVEMRSRRFVVVAHLPDPERLLTVGSSVSATVPLGQPEPRCVVPSDAILRGYSGAYVFVVATDADGATTARRVDVDLLFERSGEAVLPAEALGREAQVIVEGNERLMPGAPIAPQAVETGSTKQTAQAP